VLGSTLYPAPPVLRRCGDAIRRTGLKAPVLGSTLYPAPPVYGGAAMHRPESAGAGPSLSTLYPAPPVLRRCGDAIRRTGLKAPVLGSTLYPAPPVYGAAMRSVAPA